MCWRLCWRLAGDQPSPRISDRGRRARLTGADPLLGELAEPLDAALRAGHVDPALDPLAELGFENGVDPLRSEDRDDHRLRYGIQLALRAQPPQMGQSPEGLIAVVAGERAEQLDASVGKSFILDANGCGHYSTFFLCIFN